jgi:hypothetical protein
LSDPKVNALVKVGDGLRMAADAIDEYAETFAPRGAHRAAATSAGPETAYDIERIHWENATGDRGPFQKSSHLNSADHQALLNDVEAHKGKMTVAGYFVWLMPDGTTLARKKRSF